MTETRTLRVTFLVDFLSKRTGNLKRNFQFIDFWKVIQQHEENIIKGLEAS